MLNTLRYNLLISGKIFFYRESILVLEIRIHEGSIREAETLSSMELGIYLRSETLHNYERTHRRKDQGKYGWRVKEKSLTRNRGQELVTAIEECCLCIWKWTDCRSAGRAIVTRNCI